MLELKVLISSSKGNWKWSETLSGILSLLRHQCLPPEWYTSFNNVKPTPTKPHTPPNTATLFGGHFLSILNFHVILFGFHALFSKAVSLCSPHWVQTNASQFSQDQQNVCCSKVQQVLNFRLPSLSRLNKLFISGCALKKCSSMFISLVA